MHTTGNHIDFPILIKIAQFQSQDMGGIISNIMANKIHFPIIFQPDKTLRCRIVP